MKNNKGDKPEDTNIQKKTKILIPISSSAVMIDNESHPSFCDTSKQKICPINSDKTFDDLMNRINDLQSFSEDDESITSVIASIHGSILCSPQSAADYYFCEVLRTIPQNESTAKYLLSMDIMNSGSDPKEYIKDHFETDAYAHLSINAYNICKNLNDENFIIAEIGEMLNYCAHEPQYIKNISVDICIQTILLLNSDMITKKIIRSIFEMPQYQTDDVALRFFFEMLNNEFISNYRDILKNDIDIILKKDRSNRYGEMSLLKDDDIPAFILNLVNDDLFGGYAILLCEKYLSENNSFIETEEEREAYHKRLLNNAMLNDNYRTSHSIVLLSN